MVNSDFSTRELNHSHSRADDEHFSSTLPTGSCIFIVQGKTFMVSATFIHLEKSLSDGVARYRRHYLCWKVLCLKASIRTKRVSSRQSLITLRKPSGISWITSTSKPEHTKQDFKLIVPDHNPTELYSKPSLKTVLNLL